MHARPFIQYLIAMATCLATALPALAQSPPTARTVDVVEHPFGLEVRDPYRWMEGNDNPEFQAWLQAQGDDTRRRIDAVPSLAAWQGRLQAVSANMSINRTHRLVGDRLFFIRQAGGGMGNLMVRDGDGSERLLLDPATAGKGASITTYAPSPDGSRVAVNLDAGGSEVTHIRVLDTASATWLPDEVGPVWGQIAANWLPDGSGFTYLQLAPEAERHAGDPLTHQRVRFHAMGTPPEDDPELVRSGTRDLQPVFAPQDFLMVVHPPGSDLHVLVASGARPQSRICIGRAAGAPTASTPWRCIVDFADAVPGAEVLGNTLYLLSNKDRPNGRILAIDLSQPDASLADATEALAMDAHAIVSDLRVARDGLYVKRMRNGADELLRIGRDDGKVTVLDMPEPGTIALLSSQPDQDGVVYAMQTWTRPRQAFLGTPETPALDLKSGTTAPRDYAHLRSVLVEATSLDGTRVPLSIIHRPDIVLDGGNRALLTGYGGYGVSLQPAFSPMGLEWVDAGNVHATCHVRGGGEKGDAWHRAGQGIHKHKGIEDMIACTRELAARGYASRENVALFGGSMGGVLVGGALAHYPEAFGLAAVAVGVLNPARIAHAINGANQFAELGNPDTEDGMRALIAQDPYLALREGVRYPPVLLAVGLNDNRVSTWMSGKFAARLRAMGGGEAVVWVRIDGDTGHGLTSLDAVAATYADLYAAVEHHLPGRAPPPSP